jgi:hypothetical protein
MSGLRDEYLVMRLKDGDSSAGDATLPARSLRGYLYDKYVYRSLEHRSDGHGFGRNGSDDEAPQEAGIRVQQRPQPVA